MSVVSHLLPTDMWTAASGRMLYRLPGTSKVYFRLMPRILRSDPSTYFGLCPVSSDEAQTFLLCWGPRRIRSHGIVRRLDYKQMRLEHHLVARISHHKLHLLGATTSM
jgi:hypothetical protein